MNKSELSSENRERIQYAIEHGLNVSMWEPIALLSGGLTGIPVYKIEANDQYYAIKLENVYDENIDLARCYQALEIVSNEGLAPQVYFTDTERGIILMHYIEPQPRPQASSESAQAFAKIIRQLHDGKPFASWKSLLEILDHFYQKLSMETRQISIVQQCMEKALSLEGFLSNPSDIRPSHGDLNPSNVLFDGSKYWLVDWQAAAPRNLYFDLSCCATFFYFFNENLCIQFLKDYFDREVTQEEMEKYQLMQIFTHIYYGIGFIAISGELDPHLSVMSDDELEKLPNYLAFMQDIGAGKVNLASAKAQQQFGFIFLKTAVNMMNKNKSRGSIF